MTRFGSSDSRSVHTKMTDVVISRFRYTERTIYEKVCCIRGSITTQPISALETEAALLKIVLLMTMSLFT